MRTLPTVALAAALAVGVLPHLAGAASAIAETYGKTVPAGEPRAVDATLAAAPGLAGQTLVVQGKVSGVCKREGCWITLQDEEQGTDQALRVTFKDHAFTVPPELAGRTVVAAGVLRVTETSVERLRHLAEDAGKNAAEIAAITVPRHEATLEADALRVVGDVR